ncbi:MAG: hypothetical protein ACT4PX_06880 [Actinomycetota bacterium]
MTEHSYEQLIAGADEHYLRSEFKEASIAYGRALTVGGPRDWYCRQQRGISSRMVAGQRLGKAVEQPASRQAYLDQAARWLAKAEAYLDSALEEAPPGQRGHIRLEQARTEETVAEFLLLCGGDPGRRLAAARAYRREGQALLA